MSKIKGKDTSPEMAVRRLVYTLGYRYRLHRKELPGKPDIVFKGRRKVIFVHGCFWHGHPGCHRATIPKTNSDFWKGKIVQNKQRDREAIKKLEGMGYRCLIIWECEIKDVERLIDNITKFLENDCEDK